MLLDQACFPSIALYTCKGFDESRAIAFTRKFFAIEGEIITNAFEIRFRHLISSD